MMRTRMLIVALFVLSGCGSTSWLVHQELVGGRHVKHILKQSGVVTDSEGNKEQVFNYFVRICDLDGAGAPVRCADSLVLRDVAGGAAK